MPTRDPQPPTAASGGRVSVIIPCFNYGRFVEGAVESSFRQGSWIGEVIVVDDASEDSQTIAKLGQLEATGHERLRILRLPVNQGVSEARNAGICQAKNPFILVLDADDELLSGFLDQAMPILLQEESCGGVTCDAIWEGAESRFRPRISARRSDLLAGPCLYSLALFRKEDWEAVGGYSSALEEAWEDHDFWLSILALGKYIHLLSEAFFVYRRHRQSRDTWVRNQARQEDLQARIIRKHQQLFLEHAEEFLAGLREQDESHRERCVRRWKTSSWPVQWGIGVDRFCTKCVMRIWKLFLWRSGEDRESGTGTLPNGLCIRCENGWPTVVVFPTRVEAAWIDTPCGSKELVPGDGYFREFRVPAGVRSFPFRIRYLDGNGKRSTAISPRWSRRASKLRE